MLIRLNERESVRVPCDELAPRAGCTLPCALQYVSWDLGRLRPFIQDKVA